MDDFPQGLSSFGVPVFGGLPPILGTWYFVNPNTTYNSSSNPYQGSSSNDGLTRATPLDNLSTAYGKCVSGRGDGICLMSQGTSAANTTSALTTAITWSKHNITVYGVCAPTYQFQRARVSNLSTSTSLANLMTISGSNNRFFNMMFINEGSNAAALGGIAVTGARNYFNNVHFAGTVDSTPAVLTGTYSLSLSGAEENTFDGCVFGSDTVDMDGSQADTGIIKIASLTGRALFRNCIMQSYWSYANSTCGIVHMIGGDCIMRHVIFDGCIMMNYKTGLLATNDPASAFVGTAPNNGAFLLKNCALLGYTSWDSATGNDRVYCSMPVVTAAGGIAVVTT